MPMHVMRTYSLVQLSNFKHVMFLCTCYCIDCYLLSLTDRSFTEQPRQSTDSIEKFRFIVLGHDEDCMIEACRIILGSAQRGDGSDIATCVINDGIVNGQPVSVIKTPSTWLKQFYFSFSHALKAIKSDIEFCQSLTIPGPHAFLIVIEDVKTGKEKRLLQALCEVFGIEALDYCMVLFMKKFGQSDVQKNVCVKKCRYRSLFLQNTNQSIEELFQKTKEMKESQKILTKHLDCFEKAKIYFEMKFKTERKELEEIKDNQIEEIEKKYKNKILKLKEVHQKDLEELKLNENLLKDKLNACQLKSALDISKLKNENEMLQKEMKQLKVMMENLEKSNTQGKLQSEGALIQIQEQLQAIKEQLSKRENLERRGMLMETRERESAQRCIQSSGDIQDEHHSSTAVIHPGGGKCFHTVYKLSPLGF